MIGKTASAYVTAEEALELGRDARNDRYEKSLSDMNAQICAASRDGARSLVPAVSIQCSRRGEFVKFWEARGFVVRSSACPDGMHTHSLEVSW